MTTQHPFRRRAGLYFIVLGTSMAVMAIGLLGVTVVNVQRRVSAGADDLAQARMSAQSAIEWGIQQISGNANWRSTFPNGPWTSNQPFAKGTLSLAGVDPTDGNLADDPMDPLTLTGTGAKGQARYRLRVDLTAEARAITGLGVPLSTGGNIALSGASLTATAPISSNGAVSATSSTVGAAVQAVGSVTGGVYSGTTSPSSAAKEMPDASTVFDYYISNGTPIALSSLPRTGLLSADRVLSSVVLSPASNTFGATNALGIYVINAAGTDIYVANSRIVGTLVILDPGVNSRITGNMNFQIGPTGLPSLMVRGNVRMATTTTPDGGLLSALLSGITGLLFIDPASHVLRADGLFYVSGNVTQSGGSLPVVGSFVVGGAFTSSGTSSFTYDPQFRDAPPPGFLAPPDMVVTDGSWAPVVD